MTVYLNDGTVVETVDGREFFVTYRNGAVKVLDERDLAFRFAPGVAS